MSKISAVPLLPNKLGRFRKQNNFCDTPTFSAFHYSRLGLVINGPTFYPTKFSIYVFTKISVPYSKNFCRDYDMIDGHLHPGPLDPAIADDEVSVAEDGDFAGVPEAAILLSGTSELGQVAAVLVENLERHLKE